MQVVPDAMPEEVTRRFALLGDPTRLRMARVPRDGCGGTVGEIATSAGTS